MLKCGAFNLTLCMLCYFLKDFLKWGWLSIEPNEPMLHYKLRTHLIRACYIKVSKNSDVIVFRKFVVYGKSYAFLIN